MWTNILIGIFLTVYVIVCLLLILAVLMQRSKQDGIGAAFGSGMTESVFGAQTSNVLVKFTSWLTGLFFVLSIALAFLYGHRTTSKSSIQEQLKAVPAATAPAAPATPSAGVVTNAVPVEVPAPVTPAPSDPATNAPAAKK